MATRAWRSITGATAVSGSDAGLQARILSTTLFIRVRGIGLTSGSPDSAYFMYWGTEANRKIYLRRTIYGMGGNFVLRAAVGETDDAGFELLHEYNPGAIDPDEWYVYMVTYTKASPTTLSSVRISLFGPDNELITTGSMNGINANETLHDDHADLGRVTLVGGWGAAVDAAGLIAGAITTIDGDLLTHPDLITGFGFAEDDEDASAVEGMPALVFGGSENTNYEFLAGEWGELAQPVPYDYLRPVVVTVSGTNSGSAGTHNLSYPSGGAAGDLILLFLSMGGTAAYTLTQDGWELVQATDIGDNGRSFAVWKRILQGSDGSTTQLTTGTNQAVGYRMFRLMDGGGGDPSLFRIASNYSTVTGQSAITPPALSPGWGARNTLSFLSVHLAAARSLGTPPAGYAGSALQATNPFCGTLRKQGVFEGETPGSVPVTGTAANYRAITVLVAGLRAEEFTTPGADEFDPTDHGLEAGHTIVAEVWAGGAGGGGSSAQGWGGGGGGGGYARSLLLTGTDPDDLAVGGGGAAQQNAQGSPGGESWLRADTAVRASGGVGGRQGGQSSSGTSNPGEGTHGQVLRSGGFGGVGELVFPDPHYAAGGNGGGGAGSLADGSGPVGGAGFGGGGGAGGDYFTQGESEPGMPFGGGGGGRGSGAAGNEEEDPNYPAQAGALGAVIVSWEDAAEPEELEAEPGSFTVTGADAATLRGRVLSADPGSFALTGSDAGALHGHLLLAESGNFAVTGSDADGSRTIGLSADPGTFSVTGADAGVARTFVLHAEAGSYAVTGLDAVTIPPSIMLDAEAGIYGVTGFDAGTTVHRRMNAEPGAFTMTGSDAVHVRGLILGADAGAYAVTGFPAAVIRPGIVLEAEPGSYALTGADAAGRMAHRLSADPGAFTVTGSDAVGSLGTVPGVYVLAAMAGSFAVSGRDALTSAVTQDDGSGRRAVTRELAPFGIGAEALFTNVYFVTRSKVPFTLTLTPIVDGAPKLDARRVIEVPGNESRAVTRRHEIALYERLPDGRPGQKGLRGTWFRLRVDLDDEETIEFEDECDPIIVRRIGQIDIGGFELEAERVTLTHPDQQFVFERAVPRVLPGRERHYFFGLTGYDSMMEYGGVAQDDGEDVPLFARSRAAAPAGAGGEMIFTQLAIPIYRHNPESVTLRVLPVVDDIEQPELTLELEPTPVPLREVRHLDIYRPILDGDAEVGRMAIRGAWWQMALRAEQGVAAGSIRIGQVELECETVIESATPV